MRERHPTTSNEDSKFTGDYVQARKDGAENQKKEGDKLGRHCFVVVRQDTYQKTAV